MHDPIVSRLFSQKRKALFEAKNSEVKYFQYPINEADEDEDDLEDEDLDIDDTSQEDESIDDEEYSDYEDEDTPGPEENIPLSRSSRGSSREVDGDHSEEDIPPEDEEEPVEEEEPEQTHPNPLENDYAIRFQIGDDVVVSYAKGSQSEMKAMIDGYDKDGFYRIRWADGMTSNGFTDAALAQPASRATENVCVCGGSKFIREGKDIICDHCGRVKNRSISKIYKKPHDITTAVKPDISEAIRRAFRQNVSLNEEDHGGYTKVSRKSVLDSDGFYTDYTWYISPEDTHVFIFGDEDIYSPEDGNYDFETDSEEEAEEWFDSFRGFEDVEETVVQPESKRSDFFPLHKLKGEFWSTLDDMIQDIEALGFSVVDYNDEYVVVTDDRATDDEEMQIPLGGTLRTKILDFDKASIV